MFGLQDRLLSAPMLAGYLGIPPSRAMWTPLSPTPFSPLFLILSLHTPLAAQPRADPFPAPLRLVREEVRRARAQAPLLRGRVRQVRHHPRRGRRRRCFSRECLRPPAAARQGLERLPASRELGERARGLRETAPRAQLILREAHVRIQREGRAAGGPGESQALLHDRRPPPRRVGDDHGGRRR